MEGVQRGLDGVKRWGMEVRVAARERRRRWKIPSLISLGWPRASLHLEYTTTLDGKCHLSA